MDLYKFEEMYSGELRCIYMYIYINIIYIYIYIYV